MTIQVGDNVPQGAFAVMGAEGPSQITSEDLFTGKKVVLFAVPGAFTPTCSVAHLPGFVVHYDQLVECGVDTVACLSVNDVFVMDAWGKSANAENLVMLADGNGAYANLAWIRMPLATVWVCAVNALQWSLITVWWNCLTLTRVDLRALALKL